MAELDPGNNFARTTLGEVAAIQGRYDEAIVTLEDVLKKDPGNKDAAYGIVAVSEMSGNADSGIQYIEQKYLSDPGNVNLGVVLAEAKIARNQPQEAGRIAEDLVKRSPQDGSAHRVLAVVQMLNGQMEQAKESSRLSYDRSSGEDRAAAGELHSEILYRMKDMKAYEAFTRERLEDDPHNEDLQQEREMFEVQQPE